MLNFSKIEEEILKYWQEREIFKKTLRKDSPRGDFVFYDGPPFATGLPHYGHIVASLMKDMVPRFWTMKGYHVERKWGWDCHGLPIENIVEQELGLKHKKDIETLGVDKFNQTCESKVLKYAIEWRASIERLGRWVDMDNDYKTMDKNFMESVWWVFKQLWDKGLIYESYRSMHICPRCETTLSQSEVGQGYKDIEDLGVTAKFELIDEPGTFVLAWTTTPWTLPGNAALAVGEGIEYVKIILKSEINSKLKAQNFILAKAIFEQWPNKNEYQITEEFKGKKLLRKKYQPLFDYFNNDKLENRQKAFKIYAAVFVSTEEGTGVVHIAPGFGDDDFNLSKKENLPLINHVGMDGRLSAEVIDFAGEPAKPKGNHMATDQKVADFLTAKGLVFSVQKYFHSYPHCWRCDSPLLNYATSSYFVAVEKIKNKLLKQAAKINWMPEHIKEGRFGKWLEGARDWSISRQRYWGSVMPVWTCLSCGEKRVFGSVKELEQASGREVNDLHKHVVDNITVLCLKCKQEMRRIPDVLDCWFESGSMPYAQLHYPFENKENFEQNFPAQFIAEGADQTRAWFYYLHVLAVGIFGKLAYKNVAVNGIVLAEDGKKMSKKLKNYPDPTEMFNKYGADAMRYYLATSPVLKADDLCFSEHDLATVYKKVFLILGNVLSFYKIFEISGLKSNTKSENKLDKWIIAKTELLKQEIGEAYNNYDLVKASRPIIDYIDDLSTRYLKWSRNRFKSHDEGIKNSALVTLKYALENLALVIAPVMPFTADYLYQELGGEKESIHLENWPEVNKKLIDDDVLEKMRNVTVLIQDGLGVRSYKNIKVRQMLAELRVSKVYDLGEDYLDIVKQELNIKKITFIEKEGVPQNSDQWHCITNMKISGNDYKNYINLEISDELKEEGLFRELVRTVNQLRKEAGLTINDKVVIYYQTEAALVKQVIVKFKGDLLKNTIAGEVILGRAEDGLIVKEVEVNGHKVYLGLK